MIGASFLMIFVLSRRFLIQKLLRPLESWSEEYFFFFFHADEKTGGWGLPRLTSEWELVSTKTMA